MKTWQSIARRVRANFFHTHSGLPVPWTAFVTDPLRYPRAGVNWYLTRTFRRFKSKLGFGPPALVEAYKSSPWFPDYTLRGSNDLPGKRSAH